MRFTPQEMKLIERLRKQESRWPRTRWILIVMAACLLAIYGYIGYLILSTLESQTLSPADSAMLVALFWPKALIVLYLAFGLTAIIIRDWRGNVHRVLLLRLLDAHEKETKDHEPIG